MLGSVENFAGLPDLSERIAADAVKFIRCRVGWGR
jgi:hypothetical protein